VHQIILIVCIAAVLGGVLLQFDDGQLYLFGFKWPSKCGLYSRFGVKCAFCGFTRSFSAIAHGHIRQGVRFHLLGPAFFTYMCLQIPYRIYALAIAPRKTNRKVMKFGIGVGVLLIVALFVNWFIYLGGLII